MKDTPEAASDSRRSFMEDIDQADIDALLDGGDDMSEEFAT